MIRYNREKSFKDLEGETPSAVTVNSVYMKREGMRWCKGSTLSSPASGAGPQQREGDNCAQVADKGWTARGIMLSSGAVPTAGEIQGSQDGPFIWFTTSHLLQRGIDILVITQGASTSCEDQPLPSPLWGGAKGCNGCDAKCCRPPGTEPRGKG